MRVVITALALCLTPLLAGADSPWFTRAWQTDEDLPNNTVSGLAQTPDGYLWLGTPSGLVRFDGSHFEDFSPTNFVALPNRGTIAMVLGRHGALWLAMDRGAVVRLQGTNSHAFTQGLPTSIPSGLAEDGEGSLWIAYRGGAVYRVQNEQVSACGSQSGLPKGPDLCALSPDNQGRLWFAKAGQLGRVRNGAFHILQHFDSRPTYLAPAQAGGIWMCAGTRLFKVDDRGQLQLLGEFHPDRSDIFVTCLLEDHEGAVWIGTSYSGLFRYDQAGFQLVPTTHQEILSLAEDRDGNLWVGTAGGGLNRVRRRAIALEDSASGLPFAAVQSLCEDAQGQLWAVTENGALARRSGGRWTALAASDGWPTGAACVTADAQGRVWIGTRGPGLYCWQDGHFVTWGHPEQLRGHSLHTLLASSSGDLWIGEENPHVIQRLHAGQLTTFEIPHDSRVIRAMAEDSAGNLWVGTAKGMLLRVTGDQISEVRLRANQESASIRCLYATPDGALWLGYAGWGLGRFKAGRYTEIHADQGLFDDYISHIVADQQGWLWFGANRGVFKVRLQELEAAAAMPAPRVHSIHYGRGEGLPSLQGVFGASPDVLRSHDGRLWLPMRTGLVAVDPDKLGNNAQAPRVFLERVTLDGHPLASYGSLLPTLLGQSRLPVDSGTGEAALRLPPGHRRLEFEFAAPTFAAPETVRFRYQLEGWDEDWVEAGSRHLASYPRLPAGTYRFRVSACNSEGVWSPTGTQLALSVAPFWWQTWWCRSGGLACFTLLVVGSVRYVSFRRLHRQLHLLEAQAALHKERARIAKDIHDDLGANLTQIALMGELARQDAGQPDKAAARIETISATARQAVKSLDEIVWAVNPRNDTLAHLIDYAGQFALDYLRLAGIRCRLDFPEQAPARELSTDVRHNLFLAIKEALNNIAKHSGATEVWVRARVNEQGVELRLEDNGCGFAQAPDDALADGLRNMQQRLADVGGQCRIESRPGAGTQVILHWPWPEG